MDFIFNYFILSLIIGVFLIIYLVWQVNKLRKRMNKIKEIRTRIISGDNKEENKESNSIKLHLDGKKENDFLLDNNSSNET